jgi:hypothetical protein
MSSGIDRPYLALAHEIIALLIEKKHASQGQRDGCLVC